MQMDADLTPVVDNVPGDHSLRAPGLGDVPVKSGQVSGSSGCWLCSHLSIYLQVRSNKRELLQSQDQTRPKVYRCDKG